MRQMIFEKLSKGEWANQVFIRDPFHVAKKTLSYSEFMSYLKKTMDEINRLNVKVIALHADNSVDWIAIDLACQLLEKVCIPIPPFFSDEQTEHCLRSAGVDILFTDNAAIKAHLKGIFSDSQLQEEETLFNTLHLYRLETEQVDLPIGTQKITFTSGSTGQPKGVCLSLENQWRVAQSLAEKVAIDECHHLGILPYSTLLENIAGIYSPLLSGGSITVLSERHRGLSGSSGMNLPALLNAISASQANSMILFPQIVSLLIHAILQGWKVPKSFQFMAVGGAKVSADLMASARTSGLPVYQGYGLSECASVVALSDKSTALEAVGDVLPHLQVSIEEGEIIVKGNTFLGYLNQTDSWYPNEVRTGDLGDLTETTLFVAGRNSHLIISSFGRNISPEWVESELCAKAILTHCVVGGSDRPYLYALISAPENVSDQMLQAHFAACQKKLPDYAQVKVWHRLKITEWQGLYTANGRPKRALIAQSFKQLEDSLYSIRDSA